MTTTIAAGNTAEIYCPLATDVTFTPGSGGSMRVSVAVRSGAAVIAPQFIQAATTISISAGATVFAEAIDVDATYTAPALTAAEVAATRAMVSGAGITTWALRANVLAAGLTTAFFTDIGIGGSYWDYLGGRWRPQARRVTLANLTAEQSTVATSLGVMYSYGIPAGLWQDGDILSWNTSHTKTGGTAETATIDWRLGASAGTVGLALGLQSNSVTGTTIQQHAQHRLRRLSATTVRNLSVLGGVGLGVTTATPTTRTIPDADAAACFWQCLGNVSVGAEALNLTGATLYLESGA